MNKKVISATVTPLLSDGSLDREGLCNLLNRNIRHGLDGVFLFGSMGEWGSFSDAFKEEGEETVREKVVPVAERDPSTNKSRREFPGGYSTMMMACAGLRHISTKKWGTRQYPACKTEY